MTAKRVVKKSASKKPSPKRTVERVVPDALQSPDANSEVIQKGGDLSKGPAKKVAKVVNLIVSIGDDDRDRTIEEMIEDIKKRLSAKDARLDKKGNRVPGTSVVPTNSYYILDGKVCLPDDFDKKGKRFKKGKTPPVWAGGPKESTLVIGATQRQMEYDRENLSSDEYDKKYKIGKYKPKPDMSKIITPAMQKKALEDLKRERLLKEEEDAEDVEDDEWEESDIYDDDKMGKVADKSASAAVKKMKGGKKKRVVKTTKKPAKKAAPKKKVVTRRKK